MTTSETDVAIERIAAGGEVTVLRLASGPVNALDLRLCRALTDALADAAGHGPVVLTGAGRAFCAGVDLTRLLADGAAYVREFLPALDALFRTAFTLPVPVVAAVNGHAIAGGAILAAAADRVVMTAGRATVSVPELRIGVPLPQSAFEIVRARVGEVGVRDVVLGARDLTPTEAAAVGLVDEVVEGDVVGAAVSVAQRLAALTPADTFAATKSQLRQEAWQRIAATPLTETLDLWIAHVADGSIGRHLASVKTRTRTDPAR